MQIDINTSLSLNIISIIFMIILFFNQKVKKAYFYNLYLKIVLLICCYLVLDCIYLIFLNKEGILNNYILLISKSLYLITNSLIIYFWAKYVDFSILKNNLLKFKRTILYNFILAINLILIFINLFSGILFKISPEGHFSVNPVFMWILTIINYGLIIFISILILLRKNDISRNTLLSFIISPLLVIISEIFQIFFRFVSLSCVYAIMAFILYQTLQNELIYRDELSHLGNRRLLNEYLNRWFASKKKLTISGFMIDLDNLKKINDTYGHSYGDKALVSLSTIIAKSSLKGMVSTRCGGDEFVVIWCSDYQIDKDEYLNLIEKNKTEINKTKPDNEKIDYSIGFYCCNNNSQLTQDEFLMHLDENMYKVKREKY